MSPDESLQARRALSLRILEQPDMDGLQAWFNQRALTIVRDICGLSPNNPNYVNELIRAHGMLCEAMNYRDFGGMLKRDVANIPPPKVVTPPGT